MSNFVSLLSNVLVSSPTFRAGEIKRTNSRNTSNPFSTSENPFATYGQNRPVIGGYFAGYYNNQPNIVGRRLFIEA